MNQSDIERFMSKVSPCPNTGCWWWTAGVDKDGYGKFQTGGRATRKSWRAPRFALAMTGVDTSVPLAALHSCDNGHLGCVNPAHLSLGTLDQNNKDAMRRGRCARGERVNTARLTEPQVVEILRIGRSMSVSALARRFDIERVAIQLILKGKSWKHVPRPPHAVEPLKPTAAELEQSSRGER